MFTPEEYSDVIDAFICRMEALDKGSGEELPEVLGDICRLLRIGRIEGFLYETPRHEAMKEGARSVIYDSGNADIYSKIEMREPIGNGSIAVYAFCRVSDDEDWNEAELAKINALQKLLFTFNGRSRLEQIADDLTYNDTQLGVRNLTYFMRRAGELIAKHRIGEYGACYFNLKRFSVVNNQLGRDAGTAVMRKYIQGLEEKLSRAECVARIGGDNFIVLFLKDRMNNIMAYLNGTEIMDAQHHASFIISAYQGYYMIAPEEVKAPSDIMDKVGVAAGIAKKTPSAPCIFFNDEVRENVSRAKAIEDVFPEAVRNEEFLVYYQPKVSLKDYTLAGAEALCRWKHGGVMVHPMQFIPVLERSKLICELDFYMLDHVCRDISRWLAEGRKAVKVSVNLSRIHLGDANLLETIMSIIDRNNTPHEYIEIELTETTTDVDYGDLKRIVNGLIAEGVSTSVDDFGVGYSSLNLIRELPWNVLKIDKSFLPDGTGNDKQKHTMLKYVIAMAQELGLECIVEGVETSEQVMLLKSYNCFLAQGFYFDKPLPLTVFEKRLDGRNDTKPASVPDLLTDI